MADAKFVVEKLGDTNYATWRFRMELILIKEELYEMVSCQKPDAPDNVWLAKDGKARAIIGLALENSQLTHVMKARSAKEMWEALQSFHYRSSLVNKIHVLRQLLRLQLEEGGNMADHIASVMELSQRLEAMGDTLNGFWLVAILLSSLPQSYDVLIIALESRKDEELDLEYVKGKLLDEWRRRNENTSQQNKALKVDGGKYSERRETKKTCHYCSKEGHFRKDCWKLAEDRKEKERKGKDQRAKLVKEDDEKEEFCFTSGEVIQGDGVSWYLDSGATTHMTSNASFFKVGVSCVCASITLADGSKVSSRGSGDVPWA